MGNHLFLVVTDHPTQYSVDFEIDPDCFIRELNKMWPNSSVAISPSEAEYLARWVAIDDDGNQLISDGSLFPQFVSFRWGITDEETIEFVLWFRHFIPDTEPLLFTFDAYGTYFPITSASSRDDIRKIMATWS